MLKYNICIDSKTGFEWFETNLSGKQLLMTPLLNKGTAFTEDERRELKLLGKLPYHVETLEEQLSRALYQYQRYTSTLQKYIYLNTLHDRNEVLFYKLLSENLAEILPMIYTPGVGAAVKEFSHEFRQPRGIYIAYPDRDKIAEILENRTHQEIDLLVATDGERILGIGDQGIGGMDIPIAKLVVYSLCGVNPYRTLPVMLDVGTDNPQLLTDPMYLGWRHERIKQHEYDEFIKLFIDAVHQRLPDCLLHWEDIGQTNARRILETYQSVHCMFNDDMQGTGVVTLAAILAAIEATKVPFENHRVVIFGAGTAGVGIADQLYGAMLRQGIKPEKARAQFWLIDRYGLLIEGMEGLTSFQLPYARDSEEKDLWPNSERDLLSVVSKIKPTILIGCSTVPGAFTEEIVKTMANGVANPIIFPLSNPNENSEATPENLIKWTNARALIATGSPYDPVEYENKTFHITQCNNALSFPGIGLGVIATKAHQITDNMLWAAAQAISHHAPIHRDASQSLLPLITEIRELAIEVAVEVAQAAIKDGVARNKPTGNMTDFIRKNVWKPYYRPIKLIK